MTDVKADIYFADDPQLQMRIQMSAASVFEILYGVRRYNARISVQISRSDEIFHKM